jgi:hypothetical protein
MYSFIDVMIDCLNHVRSVALKKCCFQPIMASNRLWRCLM